MKKHILTMTLVVIAMAIGPLTLRSQAQYEPQVCVTDSCGFRHQGHGTRYGYCPLNWSTFCFWLDCGAGTNCYSNVHQGACEGAPYQYRMFIDSCYGWMVCPCEWTF